MIGDEKPMFERFSEEEIQVIVNSIQISISDILPNISTITQGAFDPLGQIAAWIYDRLKEVASWFTSTVDAVVRSFYEKIVVPALNMLSSAVGGVQTIVTSISQTLSTAWSFIQTIPQTIVNLISDLLKPLASAIDYVKTQISNIISSISDLAARLSSSLQGLWDWLKNSVNFLVSKLSDIGRWIWESLQSVGSKILESLVSIGDWIKGGFEWIGKGLGNIWSWISGAFTTLYGHFEKLTSILNSFAAYVTQFGAMVLGGISNIASFITSLPSILSELFKPIISFFTSLSLAISNFVADPVSWLKQTVIVPLWEGLRWIGDITIKGVGTFFKQIQDLFGSAVEWMKSVVSTFQSLFAQLITWVYNTFTSIADSISQTIRRIGEWIIKTIQIPMKTISSSVSILSDLVKGIFSELRLTSPPYLTVDKILGGIAVGTGTSIMVYSLLYPIMVGSRALTFSLKGLAFHIGHVLERLKISIKFLGIGGEVDFNLGQALGSTLYTIAEEIDRVSGKWLEYSSMGLLFSYGQILSRFITYNLRNYLPVEIPSIGEILESVRRGSVADSYPELVGRSFEDVYEGMKYYLALRGFSDYFISLALAESNEFYVEIKDRFETLRKIPLSLRYTLPSASEVARWLIRDIVNPPKITAKDFERNIEKLLGMRGYPLEIAKLYYISHFRYPSPSALADFFWRALAKTLWLPDSMEELEIAQVVGARYKAVSPKELNKDFRTVKDAVERYWRWHDYAPFTWYPGFTTDKAVMVELTADLPRRIDLRWLMRWGIFEHLAALIKARGISVLSPIPDIVSMIPSATGKELLSEKVTSEISLDVRLLARLLEATGYHPNFIPILSVAFAHQTLTEEMTLTRTGFLTSYKEGVLSLDASEKLMSGLFTIKFFTGFIDPETGEWVDVTYNKPLLWLSGERRLLQLRAVFDRHVDLWRDFMREVVSGVRRIAITSKDALEYMKKFFSNLSKQWSDMVKAISGVDWSPELDEKYISLWLEYADLTRIIESRIWVRQYIARVSGWLMYRVSYGWLSREDYESLIRSMVNKEWLTQYEAEFFLTMFEWISGVVRKEYIPTPSTLATLSEYMVIDRSVITMVFEKLRIPEDIRGLYEEYIQVRPIKSDFKSLLTAYRRAYIRGYISEDVWKSILNEAREYGFKDIEISLLERLADIEMLMRRVEEYIPTLSQLIQFAEYTNISKEDIERVLTARKVDKPWRDLWMKLIITRVIADDVRVLLTSYYRALRSGAKIPSEVEKACRDYFSLAGLTQEELAIRDLAVTLDQTVENLPSLGTLAAMTEYIEVPIDYISEILKRRRIEQRYAELWIKYIQTRSISAEVSRIVSIFERLYERYTLQDDLIKKIKDLMLSGGWTGREIELFTVELDLRKSYRILNTLIPSIRVFISDALYLPNWDQLFNDLIKTYGIAVDQYKSQLEYYKALVKNRRVWRHFSWWRSQLVYAYQYGAITKDQARQYLEKWKARGLVDDDEISAILEGLDLRKSGYTTYRQMRI